MPDSLATLYPHPPYDFDKLLALLARFPYPSVNLVEDGAYWRVFQFETGNALVRIRSQGTVHAPALEVSLMAQSGAIDSECLHNAVSHVLALTADRESFFEYAPTAPALWRIVEPLVGLPFLRTESPFEALTEAISEQQISWRSARRAQQWLVEWVGNRIEYNGRTYCAFPTAHQIANATREDLLPLKITFRRMDLLLELARRVADKSLDLDQIMTLPPDEAYRFLVGLHGIGHWTAAVILSRAVGYDGIVTSNDVALQAAMNFYANGLEGRATPVQLTDFYSSFEPFAGIAAAYTLARWVMDRY